MGSWRTAPTAPVAAAVVSLLMIEPRNVPCCHDVASFTSGTVCARRPPKRMAAIGTPFGSSHSGAITGHWLAGTQKRAFGCDDLRPDFGVQGRRSQSVRWAGASDMSSHLQLPSGVRAQFVNTVFFAIVFIAFGFERSLVPGATPKKPASGLIAMSRPSPPNFIHAMSSPIVSTFQPGRVGVSIARFVLPHADGNAAAMYAIFPAGSVSLRISMCSASQPSSRACTEAIRSAWHFFPRRALPPYPEPNDQISRVSGKCVMYFFSALHGHGESGVDAVGSGAPIECSPRTKSPPAPSASSTG